MDESQLITLFKEQIRNNGYNESQLLQKTRKITLE